MSPRPAARGSVEDRLSALEHELYLNQVHHIEAQRSLVKDHDEKIAQMDGHNQVFRSVLSGYIQDNDKLRGIVRRHAKRIKTLEDKTK